ncbi:MAG: SDR family NAD(P)-dependent oxidoreductase [Roseburia sp.]|nr:SDR family NAD(P)-dependent oxidoreductase [Roseburia sp.]
MKIIMITGASSGIGREFALQMDDSFTNIEEFWLVARRKEKLQELAGQLKHRVRIFDMDMTREDRLDWLEENVRERHGKICMLINCAGYGLMGRFAAQDRSEMLGMIRLNCEALTSLTHRLLPYMGENSRIIQMASSAAFLPQVDFAVYAATKSYVLSFSRALREELRNLKIYVTAVCPGPVDTPFFDIAEKTGSTLAIKKYTMVTAKKVVAKALFDSYHKKAMSVCSIPIRAFGVLAKAAPHGLLLQGTKALKVVERIKEQK